MPEEFSDESVEKEAETAALQAQNALEQAARTGPDLQPDSCLQQIATFGIQSLQRIVQGSTEALTVLSLPAQQLINHLLTEYRRIFAPPRSRRNKRRPYGIEPLEDRVMLSVVPLDYTVLANTFDGNVAADISFVTSGHENDRMHIENEELHMGVRDTMVTNGEYVPTAEKPLDISLTVNFSGPDSFYVLTRTEGTTAIGGYRSNNEIRTEISTEGKMLLIHEIQNGSWKTIAALKDVDLPLNQDLHVKVTDDGSTITMEVEEYFLSGESSMKSPVNKLGMTSWTGKETTDDHRIVHGNEVVQEDPVVPEEDPVDPGTVDAVFSDPNFTVFNDFEGNTAEQLNHVMSNHESRRNHYDGNRMVMGVRDTVIPEGQYEPTEEKPLHVSFDANFPQADSLYILTRSEASTAVGGYRSLNEVRTEIDTAGKAIRIYEVQGGSFRSIASLENVDLPMNEDLQVELSDDGTMVTITIGGYTLSGNTTGTYSAFSTGLSNWCKPIAIDNYGVRLGNEMPQQTLDPLTAKVQNAVSAELTVQLNEEAAILEEELGAESQMLLTSVSVNNRELSRIQGIQLFERSSFYIHGNDIEPILQRTLPDIFPENLQQYVQEQAALLNEEPGHIQDRILMQQSDYRGIVRGLLGSFEQAMSDLLNLTVDRVARMQAGELSEYNLMRDLRDAIGRTNSGRYIAEIGFYGIHAPSAEELYREGERLFNEEQTLLQRIQSEQGRLQEIDNFRASFREWQLGHGVPDLAVLIGGDVGRAENGYEGVLDAREQRRLGRAQRLAETAMGAMLDRRIQMRIVPEEVAIEHRLVYGGSGVTYLDVHASEQETAVMGVMDVITENIDSREHAEVGLAEDALVFGRSIDIDVASIQLPVVENTVDIAETVELTVGTNELSRWWATAGEGPMDMDWRVHVDNEGAFRLNIRGFETWDMTNATVVVDGGYELQIARTASGFQTVQAPRLPVGGHVFTLKNVGVPAEVGVNPGRFTLMKIDEMAPIVEADMQTLLVADHEEEFLNAGKVFRVEGAAETMDVNELISHFAPILHFHPDERFATPFAIENIELDSTGSSNANIDLSQYESGSFDPQNTQGAMYASVLRNDGQNEIAISYNFFYPRSNWGEHDGFNTHEGDWEGATIFLKMDGDMRWVPDRVAVAQHEKRLGTQPSLNDGGDVVAWSELSTAGSRPHLFVGLGGHATYTSEGATDITELGKTYSESHIDSNYTGIDAGIRTPVIYLPRASSASETETNWLLYTGSWGTDKNDLGGSAPNGPMYIGGGFEPGTRWLNPWLWKYDFK